jgi:phosphohistidine phosphatase
MLREMERRLIVLRHAKSAWDTDAADDHSRPLAKRGRRDARRIAEQLREAGWVPERVVSSDAARTVETWRRMADQIGSGIEVVFTRELYHAGLDAVQRLVGASADTVRTVMAIGHNPGWEEVVGGLCGTGVTMTTCNAALLAVEAESWAEALAKVGGWTLHDRLRPREP